MLVHLLIPFFFLTRIVFLAKVQLLFGFLPQHTIPRLEHPITPSKSAMRLGLRAMTSEVRLDCGTKLLVTAELLRPLCAAIMTRISLLVIL
jgi:hypothetical protein